MTENAPPEAEIRRRIAVGGPLPVAHYMELCGYTTHDFAAQMIIFETTFLTLAFANAFGYALIASRARTMVQNPPKRSASSTKQAEPAYRCRRRNSRGSCGCA